MADIAAFADAGDTGNRAVALANDLEQMFYEFVAKVEGKLGGEITGKTAVAIQAARDDWMREANSLREAQAQLGTTMTRNVNALLDTDQQWSKMIYPG